MATTYLLARIIGWFMLVMGASLFSRRVFNQVVEDLLANQALLYFSGIIALGGGIGIIVSHNVWGGSFLETVITIIGWVMLLKGFFALVTPKATIVRSMRWFNIRGYWWLYGCIMVILGIYLILSGLAG